MSVIESIKFLVTVFLIAFPVLAVFFWFVQWSNKPRG